jgi:hypothetical protein
LALAQCRPDFCLLADRPEGLPEASGLDADTLAHAAFIQILPLSQLHSPSDVAASDPLMLVQAKKVQIWVALVWVSLKGGTVAQEGRQEGHGISSKGHQQALQE